MGNRKGKLKVNMISKGKDDGNSNGNWKGNGTKKRKGNPKEKGKFKV